MLYVLLGLGLFLLLLLVSIRLTMSRSRDDEEPQEQVIHASGVYSVVRRSPREAVMAMKPTEEQVRQYLASKNEDITGAQLTESDKERLAARYFGALDANITEIESGDSEDVEFYYYDNSPTDSVCEGLVSKGQFVTREDIYKHPRLVPPFHLGCTCRIRRQHVTDDVRKTIAVNMRPLITDDSTPPKLPNWRSILKLT